MKKRLFVMAAAAVLCVGALAGCSSNQQQESAPQSTSSNEAVAAVEQRTVYVTPEWLNSAQAGEQSGYEEVLVAEVVYDESGLADTYNKGHIPGATYVTDVDVEDADGTEERPYNILPVDELEKNILARGITKDTKVVLYGQDPSGVGRVAYGLLYAGVEDVKIVNGGLTAWEAAGFSTEKTKNEPTAAEDFGTTVPAHPEYLVSMADAKDKLENDDTFKLVSIRAEAEWLGETSGYGYIDRAGEPEGAVWGKGAQTAADVADFTNEDGTVKNLDGLKEVWADCDFNIDSDHLSFYCGTGWRATVPFLVLYENGYDNISVYDGGWYEWQMHGENPVQVGDPASDDCVHTTVGELPTDKAAKE